jgi:hypothetical protein
MSQVQEPEARSWLFTMFDTVPHKQLVQFCVTSWAIWRARLKAIHEGIFQSPLSTHHFIEIFLADLEQSGKSVKAAVVGTRKAAAPKPKPAAWIPSPAGVVKVNVDAAVARNKDHGVAAAVARMATGQYLGSSAVLITGISDPEVLEAIAVREGQNLALDIAASKILVASDCLSVVKAWKQENLGRYSHILHEISSSSVVFSEFSLVHENRVSNNEPHVLARSVLGSPVGRYMWLGVPPEGVLYPSIPE